MISGLWGIELPMFLHKITVLPRFRWPSRFRYTFLLVPLDSLSLCKYGSVWVSLLYVQPGKTQLIKNSNSSSNSLTKSTWKDETMSGVIWIWPLSSDCWGLMYSWVLAIIRWSYENIKKSEKEVQTKLKVNKTWKVKVRILTCKWCLMKIFSSFKAKVSSAISSSADTEVSLP